MDFVVHKFASANALLDKYGFGEREDFNSGKHWYSFAGKYAKLTDAEVEALEFDLYNLYGEHLKLTPQKGLDVKDIEDEYKDLSPKDFLKKFGYYRKDDIRKLTSTEETDVDRIKL